MSDCNHEEADTRMMVDVEHLLVSGAKTIGIFRTGVWATSLQPQQNLPSPSDFGWKKTDPNSHWDHNGFLKRRPVKSAESL